MSRTSIDEAARAAMSGGRRDLERFLDLLRPLVCRWALVWTGSPDEAEDVAQAVLMRVHRSLEDFSPAGSVTTWVYKITRNTLIDLDRAAGRERTRRDALERDVAELARGRSNALEILGAADLLGRLMREVSPQQRAALDLVELQGFTHAEAAEMLGITIATVRVHLHRARRAIGRRGRLDGQGHPEEA